MSKRHFPESELIINADGSCFHLHLKPEQLADKIILVGDPARVDTVAAHFDSKECEVSSREFHTITGTYKGKRITVQSHGIGCDNIDIVVNELDTLANIDYQTREEKDEHRTLTMVRIGTCGGLQPFTPTGSFIASVKSIGFDGLLNYYAGRNVVCDIDLEKAFCEHMQWDPIKGAPYVSLADEKLIDQIAAENDISKLNQAQEMLDTAYSYFSQITALNCSMSGPTATAIEEASEAMKYSIGEQKERIEDCIESIRRTISKYQAIDESLKNTINTSV